MTTLQNAQSKLFSAMIATPNAFTHNGMPTLSSSGSDLLDLFGTIGNRTFSFNQFFYKMKTAMATDKILFGRLLLWSRDCRGGAGHRDPIRKFILEVENQETEFVIALAKRLPELGYYKDLIHIYENSSNKALKDSIIDTFMLELVSALREKRKSLLAKYLPRKGELAAQFRTEMKFTPKEYRKLIVSLSKTVEQQMCAKDWDGINFEQVPSVAMLRYRKAFERHTEQYAKYQEKVSKGEAKINSAQLTPGELVNKCRSAIGTTENAYFTNAWNALPDYLDGSDEKWLPVIDVSGSMDCNAGSTNIRCMDVAVGLGLYLAERNKGLFKNQFITFSSRPEVIDLSSRKFDSFKDKINFIMRANWSMSTNIEAVFNLVLTSAVKHKLSEEDMPAKIVIFSDMEMNRCTDVSQRLLEMIDAKYKAAGYTRPQLVFWNIQGRAGNMTVNLNDNGACQISGYTPAILKNLTKLEKFTPLSVMLETLGSERYNF